MAMRSKLFPGNRALTHLFLLLCMFAAASGCTPKKNTVTGPAPTDLQKKFELRCLKDYKLNVITRISGKTFWIYAPTDKPLFDFGTETSGRADPLKKAAKYDLLSVNGSYENNAFYFKYDIIPKIGSDTASEGIRNEGTDYFNKLYNNLFTAVTETLIDPKNPISFVVMAMTDIKKGIEVRYTFYLEDFRKVSVEAIPSDEFQKRVLQEEKGNADYIGDEIGQHLEYNDINMPDFLSKQMVNRIRFKFTQSDFPPQENYEEAIIGIVADTCRYYHFTDFKEVRTDDLRNNKKMIFTPKQLDFFGEDKPKNAGQKPTDKTIPLIFEDSKAIPKGQ